MTISYHWLSEYLPEPIEPARLSKILTSIGLEVESLEPFEQIKGGLKGLVVGEVKQVSLHPNADKLTLISVDTGTNSLLEIVCGASNVAVGQKVVVAPVGTTIYPIKGEPVTMKAAKIRGFDSHGMLCAEDEIGLSANHDGIMVLDASFIAGRPLADYFKNYTDHIYEIGLTPNRMDAMSHIGVAKDVCAYLSYHNKKDTRAKLPQVNNFKADNQQLPIKVTIENSAACRRYAGITIKGVTVKESPDWLKNKLLSIGQRPINNIVDITNFILNESGQPLHAFDVNAITGAEVTVKNLPGDTLFTTLDEKERKLFADDLIICNANEGMCLAGVFGGLHSGVTATTTNLFLESAWFNPTAIRKTSFRHNLRTDAAARFEKGVDIANVVTQLKRAALLIKEIAGGTISSDIVDVYPDPLQKTEVSLKYHYLKKLSGKNYHPDALNKILTALGFEIIKEGIDELRVTVPFNKPDITLPADVVEEIIRIDGLDNIDISGAISFTPSGVSNRTKEALKEKIAGYLAGQGYSEIVTNSITNSSYFTEEVLKGAVKMMNSLSADLDVMRPSMVETGLEIIAYNQNRKNSDLRLFEFGKTYGQTGNNKYVETELLAIYLYGFKAADGWNTKQLSADFFEAKGLANALLQLCGLGKLPTKTIQGDLYKHLQVTEQGGKQLVKIGEVDKQKLQAFGLKQPVFYVEVAWNTLVELVQKQTIVYTEVSRYPKVERDVALIVDKQVPFSQIEALVYNLNLQKLKEVRLFDIFESDKLGAGKKSVAINLIFLDEEKTLTDVETDAMVQQIITSLTSQAGATIRN